MQLAAIKGMVCLQALAALLWFNSATQLKQHDYHIGQTVKKEWSTGKVSTGTVVRINKNTVIVHWNNAPRGWEDELSKKELSR